MDKDQFAVERRPLSRRRHLDCAGLQFDITARGSDPVEASERFNQKIGAEFIMSMDIGEDPLAGVPRAPQEFWDMYEAAKMRVFTMETAPIQVNEGP